MGRVVHFSGRCVARMTMNVLQQSVRVRSLAIMTIMSTTIKKNQIILNLALFSVQISLHQTCAN